MTVATLPLQLLLLTVSGWVHRHQQDVIAYLVEENRVLKEQLGGRKLRLTDDQRRRLAAKARLLGRRARRRRHARHPRYAALVRGCGQAYALQTVEPVTSRCGTRRVCQARSSGSERYTRARPHAVAPMNCVPEDSRRRSTCTGRTHSPRARADGNQTPRPSTAWRCTTSSRASRTKTPTSSALVGAIASGPRWRPRASAAYALSRPTRRSKLARAHDADVGKLAGAGLVAGGVHGGPAAPIWSFS